MKERWILRGLFVFGLILIPIVYRKQPIKDWILVFLIKCFYSWFIDSFVVASKQISYPVRILPHIFKIHVLFDVFLFPLACVMYNQLTYRNNTFLDIVIKVFLFSVPITLIEVWAERKTKLIKFRKNWSAWISFATLTLSFWLVRATMGAIRMWNDRNVHNSVEEV
ncbi:CBO0543 family protein [Evansella cellulosilytica]|uniref:Uncharacterized protein n=1 Tax=Evansella cellulosilytica (strain ATCC 21833 / DSM 2522 / FERM P-1141 / JCM 9156 / N-4) TaxID=649639 RepID=E6TVM0_EVAC2|nr:CBO0543 family protein [Evansella cellulosilytica]ADU32148.1 hypothetical protein Bcell_3912 [Evansella cellulosilytica DSM 2522]